MTAVMNRPAEGAYRGVEAALRSRAPAPGDGHVFEAVGPVEARGGEAEPVEAGVARDLHLIRIEGDGHEDARVLHVEVVNVEVLAGMVVAQADVGSLVDVVPAETS
jgi:hypothetical protein